MCDFFLLKSFWLHIHFKFKHEPLKSCHTNHNRSKLFLYCFLKYCLFYFSRIQKPSHPCKLFWRWRYCITHCCWKWTWKHYKVLPRGAQLSWCQSFKLWWTVYPNDVGCSRRKAQCGQVLHWSCTRWLKFFL